MSNETVFVGSRLAEQWSNGTQPTDPPAGYTAWNASGVVTAQRALSAAESAQFAALDVAATQAGNQSTVQQQAQNALAANRTYLAVSSPSNAQVAAQVKALTQQANGLIRLALGQFDGTN